MDCSDYSTCSVSCGSGTQTCQRTCENGNFGDIGCPQDQQVNTQSCNPQQCRKYSFLTQYRAEVNQNIKLKLWIALITTNAVLLVGVELKHAAEHATMEVLEMLDVQMSWKLIHKRVILKNVVSFGDTNGKLFSRE